MPSLNYRSIQCWPGERCKSRRQSQFDTPWQKTINLLLSELDKLNARNLVIELDCDESQIKLDGGLRAHAQMRGPGVIVGFESAKGPMRFPCDTFLDWRDNIRAIAKALEALRAVDRYGVTLKNEQYRGWSALPDRTTEKTSKRQQAAEWIVQACIAELEGDVPEIAEILNAPGTLDYYIRRLKAALHPDSKKGDATMFKQLMEHLAAFDL